MKKMKKTIVALTCLGLAFASVGAYQATTAQTAQAAENPDFACAGASIRLDTNTADGIETGIRFRVKIKADLLTTVGADNVQILVMPTDLLGDGVLDLDDADAAKETLTDWRDFVNDDNTTDPTYKQAYAYVYDMTEEEYNRPTTWRAFYMDGETPVYSDQMERSLSEVALCLENDENETTERKAMAGNYILNYTYTYDHGVRGTDGEWKTTTHEFRYGAELTTAISTEPTTDAREDFEFLAWEMTKGSDKVKEKEGKTILTGNVTEEAYWLLTGEISLDTPEKVAEYADFAYEGNTNTEVKENTTGTGVAFATNRGNKDISRYTEYAHLEWKNIVVNTDLNCRFNGYVESEGRDSDGAQGVTNAYFDIGESGYTSSVDHQLYNIQHESFDIFETLDISKFANYGTEEGYYELADFILEANNAVSAVNQTSTFEKFQIGATQNLAGKTGNLDADKSWNWIASGSTYTIKSTDDSTKILASESYLWCATDKTANGGVDVFGLYINGLTAGDKIELTIKSDYIYEVEINNSAKLEKGGQNFDESGKGWAWLPATTGFETITLTVADGSPKWLYIGSSRNVKANFVIQDIKIIKAS